jgi:hypothetical protein
MASQLFEGSPPPLVAPVPSPSPSPPQPVIANIDPKTIDNKICCFFIPIASFAAVSASVEADCYQLGTLW